MSVSIIRKGPPLARARRPCAAAGSRVQRRGTHCAGPCSRAHSGTTAARGGDPGAAAAATLCGPGGVCVSWHMYHILRIFHFLLHQPREYLLNNQTNPKGTLNYHIMTFSGASVRCGTTAAIRGPAHTVCGSAHTVCTHPCRGRRDSCAPLTHPGDRRRRGEAAGGRDQQAWTGSTVFTPFRFIQVLFNVRALGNFPLLGSKKLVRVF